MRTLVTVFALGILVLVLAVLFGGSDVWALDLLTFFWPILSMAAIAVLLLTLVAGGMAARLAALAAVAACAFPFVALPPAPADEAGEKLRLLTANLYVGNPDPRPFVALLTREQPDIVVTFGGTADGDYSLRDSSSDYFVALRAALPDAELVAINPVTTGDDAPYWLTLHLQTIQAAVEAVDGTFVDVGQPGVGDGDSLSTEAHAAIAESVTRTLS